MGAKEKFEVGKVWKWCPIYECMCVCVYTYACICLYVCRQGVLVGTFECVCTRTHTRVHVHVCAHLLVYVRTWVGTCVSVLLCIHVCVCLCVWYMRSVPYAQTNKIIHQEESTRQVQQEAVTRTVSASFHTETQREDQGMGVKHRNGHVS